MSVIYLEAFAGVSGNMLLGALLNLGVPEERLRSALCGLHIDGYKLEIQTVQKRGVTAVYVDVKNSTRFSWGQQPHRHLTQIKQIIDQAELPESVKQTSKQVFDALARAEAKVHGTTVEQVHFHEVGAVDTIIDIVGTVYGLHILGVGQLYCSRLQTGRGFVRCSHGNMPIPAPATAELLHNFGYYHGEIDHELVTPTGAALLSVLARYSPEPPDGFISETIGYGAGTWDLDIPNVLCARLGKLCEYQPGVKTDGLQVIEANIDDMNPQVYPYVMDQLLAMGCADVWLTPIIMKHGRPAVTLSVLVSGDQLDGVVQHLLRETQTIGIRFHPVERKIAQRRMVSVDTLWGKVVVKVCDYQGKRCNVFPEYADCAALAQQHQIPLKDVQQQALVKFWEQCGNQTDKSIGE